MEALTRAFNTQKHGCCALTSVKSNIGHLNASAGVAGFIKAVLVLTHGRIPPSLHFREANPEIDFENSPFYVNTGLLDFENGPHPRRAAVNSFGIGGTNAHIILEEAPEPSGAAVYAPPAAHIEQFHLLLLSANSPTALDTLSHNLARHLETCASIDLADVAYTLQTGRKAFKHRKIIVCSSTSEAVELLTRTGPGLPSDRVKTAYVKHDTGADNRGDELVQQWTANPDVAVLTAIGELWLKGIIIDWDSFYAAHAQQRQRLRLPLYPFETRSFPTGRDVVRTTLDMLYHEGRLQENTGVAVKHPRPHLDTDYVSPSTDLQKTLVRIWENFFGFERLGIHDDFFKLGGDSLKVVKLLQRIHNECGTVIPVADFFNAPTIEGAALFIDGSSGEEKAERIEPVEEKEYYPLSPAQERLFIIQQMDKTATLYNEFYMAPLMGHPDRELIKGVIRRLIHRHECLRTSFFMVDDKPVQHIHPPGDLTVELEYREIEHPDRDLAAEIAAFVHPFDLGNPPLMRIRLIKGGTEKYMLMFDMHHIITDGMSMRVFMEEVDTLKSGGTLPPLPVRYRDYAQWLKHPRRRAAMKQQEFYWLKQFETPPPPLKLPLDHVRSGDFGRQGYVLVPVPEEVTTPLRTIAANEGATMFMLLLALYYVFLSKITGQYDIVVGTLIAGRSHPDLEVVLGMFVNTLAMRSQLPQTATFRQFLRQVRTQALEALANQDYPFDRLVDHAAGKRMPHRNPMFDAAFSYFTMKSEAKDPLENSQAEDQISAGLSATMAKFDLILGVKDQTYELLLNLNYDTTLFEEATVRRFIGYFVEIGLMVRDNPDIPLTQISVTHDLEAADKTVIEEDEGDFGF
jgi:acyl carrier protein